MTDTRLVYRTFYLKPDLMMQRIITLLSIVFISTAAYGQINTDSLFNAAVEHSKEQNYDRALEDARIVLDLFPERADVLLFMANVNAWKGDYDTSKQYIDKAFSIDQKKPELYDTWLNVLLWSRDFEKILEIIELAAKNRYPNEYNLVLKRAIALKELERYATGIHFLNQNPAYSDSAAVRYIYQELQALNRQNMITFYYSIDFFKDKDLTPQHLAFIDYGFKVGRNTLILRAYYANRFKNHDFQAEVDYYHIFRSGNYLYSSYGIGILREHFPHHRLGLEYYAPLGRGFEGSIGGRYLRFEDESVYILTGHIGKYISDWWLAFRPFYTIKSDSVVDMRYSISALANARVYGSNGINYWGIELGYGSSPDNRFDLLQPGESRWLDSYKIKLERNMKIKKANEFKVAAGWIYEEQSLNGFRNRLNIELIFKYRF